MQKETLMKITKKKSDKLINEETEKVIKERLILETPERLRKPKFADIKNWKSVAEFGSPDAVQKIRDVHGKDAQALANAMAPWMLNWITHWANWNHEGADGSGRPTQSFDDFMEDFAYFVQQAASSGLRRPLFYKIYNKAVATMDTAFDMSDEETEQDRREREEREGRIPATQYRAGNDEQ